MRIAIYSDRLLDEYFGGAEVYSIRLANLLSKHNSVTLFCNNVKNFAQKENKLRQSFAELNNDISIVPIKGVGGDGNPPHKEYYAHKELSKTIENYDLFINISNNLVPGFSTVPSYALIHFPIYLHKINPLNKKFASNINNTYVGSYKKLIGNSKFTADNIEKMYCCNAEYIYPIPDLNIKEPN